MKISRRKVLTQALPVLVPAGVVHVMAHASSATVAHPANKTGLLVIGHGSPREEWNAAFRGLGDRVAEMNQKRGSFAAVRTVLMEFAEPTIAQGLDELQSEGCNAIVAVPAFVTVGHHTLFDVPAALGNYYSYSQHSLEHLSEHGVSIPATKVPVIYTCALDEGDLLERFTYAEIKALSQDSEREALVLLVHGDSEQRPLLERRLRDLMIYCCAKSGISYADYAMIGVGQGFEHHGIPVLLKAASKRERVLVIGLHMGLSAEGIATRSARVRPNAMADLQGRDIVFSNGNLIDFPETAEHILHIAESAVQARQSLHR
ncbi:CbiX/SirB N-terminal domain-containing protein [Thermogutta sp.]|jgi:hypothetical protein|uniref:sirohydrochlorin chelatase n=1 Tax=Thermogutta sp. TaxID=1962930 RepID=UPI0032202B8A